VVNGAGHPVFVGGTGRSGTSILGKVLGRHPHYAMVETELVFHAAPGGIPDLLEGHVRLERFIEKLRNAWWYSERPEGAKFRERGLHRVIPEERFEAALEVLSGAFADDPVTACREFVDALVQPIADDAGKPSWIDTTPYNPFYGRALLDLYPDMRLIHIVRDGRDVASSVAGIYFGPETPLGALRWWEERMRRADAGSRGLPPDRLLVISFEDLVVNARDETYGRLLEFLGVEDAPRLRRAFDNRLSPDSANIGRWRSLPHRDRTDLDASYRAVLLRMRRDGIGCAPPFDPEWGVDPDLSSATVAREMAFRIHVLYSGPRSEHEAVSPGMTYEEAQGELRAIRRQCDEGGEVVRSWAFLPASSIVAAYVSEDSGTD